MLESDGCDGDVPRLGVLIASFLDCILVTLLTPSVPKFPVHFLYQVINKNNGINMKKQEQIKGYQKKKIINVSLIDAIRPCLNLSSLMRQPTAQYSLQNWQNCRIDSKFAHTPHSFCFRSHTYILSQNLKLYFSTTCVFGRGTGFFSEVCYVVDKMGAL